jgi:5'-3' exonuclease
MIKGPKKQIEPEIVIRTVKNCPNSYDDTKRVLLIDSDSILYTCTYFPEDSIMHFPTEEEQIEEAKFRVRNKLQEIQNNVEEYYNIVSTILFVGGKNNFRYKLYPLYKANRDNQIKNPLVPIIKQYIVEQMGAIESHGAEADDYLIECLQEVKNNAVVSSIDKDIIYQSPNVPIYNYRSYDDILGEFKYVTIKESRLVFASSILCGDSTDNILGAKGIGKAYCFKNLHENMTDYQFIRAIFVAYLKSTKGDSVEAKKQIRLNYILLKLHTQEEVKNILDKYEH